MHILDSAAQNLSTITVTGPSPSWASLGPKTKCNRFGLFGPVSGNCSGHGRRSAYLMYK